MASPARSVRWSEIWNELPVALLMRRQQQLYGVVWLFYRRKYGLPIGLAKAGNLCGQGSVVADIVDRVSVLETASRVLLRHRLAHTVVVSTLWTGHAAGFEPPVAHIRGQWLLRDVRFRLDLDGGHEATLQRLSHKMRRNLRYYRRRAEAEFGCEFVPELTHEQRNEAVAALFDQAPFQIGARRAWQMEAALRVTPGGLAMGLRDRHGTWLSYIAGWRSADGLHVDWQLNLVCHKQASISTVMRAYMLEYEAARSTPAILFVGLTSDFWSRACEPDVCADLLATRPGFTGNLARWLARWISSEGQVARLHDQAALAQSP